MSTQGIISRVLFVKQLVIALFFVIITACNTQSQIPIVVEPNPGIAFVSDLSGNWDLYVVQPDGSGLTQLTDNPKLDGDPDWSPDGRYLIFSSSCVAPEAQLYLHDTETGETSQLTSERLYHTHPTWSHDGQYLAFVLNIAGNSDIFILDLATYNRIQQTNHPAKDNMPS